MRAVVAVLAMLLAGRVQAAPAPAEQAPAATCRFRGSPPIDLDMSRASACRAVLEGLGDDPPGTRAFVITISFAAPATATVTFVGGGSPPAPISIAIGANAVRRRDFYALGRTIMALLRAY